MAYWEVGDENEISGKIRRLTLKLQSVCFWLILVSFFFFNHAFWRKGWPPNGEIMEGMEKCQITRLRHRNVSFRTYWKAPWRGSRRSRSRHGWKNGWLEVGVKGTGFTQVHLTEKTCKRFFQKKVGNSVIAKLFRSQCVVFCRCHPGVSQKTFSVAVPNELKPISNCCLVHCIQIENSCLSQLPSWKKTNAFLGCQRPLLLMENFYCLSCSTKYLFLGSTWS